MLKNYLTVKFPVLGLTLIFCVSPQAQSDLRPEARLISRFEQRVGYPSNYEVLTAVRALSEFVSAKNPNDRVAIRLCSTDSMLRAFHTAAVGPDEIKFHMSTGWLVGWHKISGERTLILRSADCLGDDPAVAPVEIWALPGGAAPPASSESIKFCQLRLEYLSLNHLKGHRPRLIKRREYETALRKLIATLRADPNSFGVLQGYVLKGPNPKAEQNLKDIQSFMGRHGIQQTKYVVRLGQYWGDFSPLTPEPNYPDVHLVRLAESCLKE